MVFHEKLDFLMKLTHTRNSELGRALNYDASYISRIRSGRRGLPRQQPFLEPAAAYFARRIVDLYQKKAAAEVVCPGELWPEDSAGAEKLLTRWMGSAPQAENPVGRLVTGLARMGTAEPVSGAEIPAAEPVSFADGFFFGNAGKRAGVERFLAVACAQQPAPELLLYSDEDMTWLYEDPAFARRWAALMAAFLARGGRICMIHTVSRNLGEMLEAIQKWMPLYCSGSVQPYYCPRIRDGIGRRTLFLARGRCALTSHSVEDRTEGMANVFVTNRDVVAALEREFENLLALCRPLMEIFTPASADGLFSALDRLAEAPGAWITAQRTPSVHTMPPAVAREMAKRQGNNRLLRRRDRLNGELTAFLQSGGHATEILCLPTAEEIRASQAVLPLSAWEPEPALRYTPAEFAAHLREMIRMMEQYESYRVVLSRTVPDNILFFVKEDGGVLLASERTPFTGFVIRETRMTAACWEYLRQIAEESGSHSAAIRALESLAAKLV